MELLGDVALVEPCFGLFGDSVNLSTTKVHGLGRTYHMLVSFWVHPMELLDDVDQMEARFSLFGDSSNLDARQVHSLRQTYN
jgi:hypothetical protein